MMRLWAIPYSTNVERVTLALAFKGVSAEIVYVDPRERSEVRALSGQDLVPLLEDGADVVFDSPRILRHLEERHPSPSLYPRHPARREEVEVFIDWFNLVWKKPPNAIDAELQKANPDQAHVEELSAWLAESLDRFEALLTDRAYLAGDEFGVADCIAFPFLKYAVRPPAADDPDTFHAVLWHYLVPAPRHARLREWIAAVDGLRESRC